MDCETSVRLFLKSAQRLHSHLAATSWSPEELLIQKNSVQDLDASAAGGTFGGFGACLVARYPPIAAIVIPRIKGSFTCGQLPSLVVLTIALTMGAPAKITDMITGTYAGDGILPKASKTPKAPIAPKVPAISVRRARIHAVTFCCRHHDS